METVKWGGLKEVPGGPPAQVKAVGYFDNVYIDDGPFSWNLFLPAMIRSSQPEDFETLEN